MPEVAWFCNYSQGSPDGKLGIPPRALVLDDDGTVRCIDMAAGSNPDRLHPTVAERMTMGQPGGTSSTRGSNRCDVDQLTATSRATTRQVLERPRQVASALLRPLFRDIGSEKTLDQLEPDPVAAAG